MNVFDLMAKLSLDTSEYKNGLTQSENQAKSAGSKISGAMKGIATAVGVGFSVAKIIEFGKASLTAYNYQKEQETKLETIMKQRMKSTDAGIQSIKNYTAELQKSGVVGDEVQMAGAQQVATYLKSEKALKTLIPAMNNLGVQQHGVSVTGEQMNSIGNMFGKVMNGQTSALKRAGISFTEAQEKVLKYGTEEEKASMLAKVVEENIGDMNKVMAQTDAGKIQQAKNAFGDLQEAVGARIAPAIGNLAEKIRDFSDYMTNNVLPAVDKFGAFLKENEGTIKLVGSAIAGVVVALGTLSIIMTVVGWVQSIITFMGVFGGVLGTVKVALMAFWAVLSANPIGIIITLIGALVGVLIYLYKNNETVRNAINKAWDTIKGKVSGAITIISNLIKVLAGKIYITWMTIKASTAKAWNGIKTAVSTAFNAVKGVVSKVVNNVKSTVTGAWNTVKSKTSSAWNAIKTAITKPFETAKNTIQKVVNKIKGFFPLKIGKIFSSLKVPKITVTGGKAPFGIAGMGSLPKFHVTWNRIAEKVPYLFKKGQATLFGAGDANDEIMYGKANLMKDIQKAVENVKNVEPEPIYEYETEADTEVIVNNDDNRILNLLESYMPRLLNAMNVQVVLNDGTLVGKLAPKIDESLGDVYRIKTRRNAW